MGSEQENIHGQKTVKLFLPGPTGQPHVRPYSAPVSPSTKKPRGANAQFQERLRSLTKDGNGKWTKRGLALAAKLPSASHVRQYISGEIKDPGLENVEKIARAAEVSPSWLAFGDAPEVAASSGPRAAAVERLRGLLPEAVVQRLHADDREMSEIEWLHEALDELREHIRRLEAGKHRPPLQLGAGTTAARDEIVEATERGAAKRGRRKGNG